MPSSVSAREEESRRVEESSAALDDFMASKYLEQRPHTSYLSALSSSLDVIPTETKNQRAAMTKARERAIYADPLTSERASTAHGRSHSEQSSLPPISQTPGRLSKQLSSQKGLSRTAPPSMGTTRQLDRGSSRKDALANSPLRRGKRPTTPEWDESSPRRVQPVRHQHSLVNRIRNWRVRSGKAAASEERTLASLKAGENWLKLQQKGVTGLTAIRTLQTDVREGVTGERILRPPMTRKELIKLRMSAPPWWAMPDTARRAADRFDNLHRTRSAWADQLCLFEVRVNRYFVPPVLEGVKTYERKQRVKPVHAFDLYKSIWAPRCKWADSKDLWDTDDVEFRRFSLEWDMLLQLGLVKLVLMWDDDKDGALADEDGDGIPDEVEDVGMVFWNCHDLLHAVFTYYSQFCEGACVMSLNQFTAFSEDFKLVDKKSKFCKRSDFDLMFVEVNAISKFAEGDLSSGGDSQNGLTRLEFYSALVRVAVRKYVMEKKITDVSEALEKLILSDIYQRSLTVGTTSKIFIDANDFRRDHCYVERCCNVLKANETSLRNLFGAVCRMGGAFEGATAKNDDKDLISFAEWLSFLRGLTLINADISERDAGLCFAWSRMVVVDTRKLKGLKRDICLPFEGFMEALCRVSVLKALPTQQEMFDAHCENAGAYIDMLREQGTYQELLSRGGTPWGEQPKVDVHASLEMLIGIIRNEIEKMTKSGTNDGVISEAEAKQFVKKCAMTER